MKDLLSLYAAFFKIGAMTFGGGYAMLPMLERELIENRKWIEHDELLDYFAIGQCTPGVIAVNTATFIGYKKKKIAGGIFATLGVISPSIIIITVIAALLTNFADNVYVAKALVGIRIAVCALILSSVVKIVKSNIKKPVHIIIAIIAFLLVAFLGMSPVIIVFAAALCGLIFPCEVKKEDKK